MDPYAPVRPSNIYYVCSVYGDRRGMLVDGTPKEVTEFRGLFFVERRAVCKVRKRFGYFET